MEFWEFLIQKEGDRSWLPLESPRVEILEGRYRVMARSSRANTPVEIGVTHEAIVEHPPKRRIQKRTSQTNPDGLIVVIPFTRLVPGIWELRCMGDLMSDMLGQSWQYTVRLQVVAHEMATDGDWEPDWDESMEAVTHRDTVSVPTASESAEPTAPEPTWSPPPADSPAPTPHPEWAELIGLAWQLPLTRDTHLVSRDSPLLLEGQITVEGDDPALAGSAPPVELCLALRHPQTADLVLDMCYPLQITDLPCPIQLQAPLPANGDTRLLLGELRLMLPTAADPVLLATQSFTVITAVDELLDAIAHPDPHSPLYAPLEFLKTGDAPLNLAFLELLDAPRSMVQFQVVEKETLPPQLYPSELGRSRSRGLDLPFSSSHSILGISPVFDAAVQEAIAASQAMPSPSPAATGQPPEADPSAPAAAEPPPVGPGEVPTLEAEALPLPLVNAGDPGEATGGMQPRVEEPAGMEQPLPQAASPDPSEQTGGQSLPFALPELKPSTPLPARLKASLTPESEAFQALNLRQRFWQRLTTMAAQAEPPSQTDARESLPPPTPSGAVWGGDGTGRDTDLTSQEFVVEDEAPARPGATPPPDAAPGDAPMAILPPDEAVPAPRLEIPPGELTAGRAVKIVAILPPVEPRIYVKLWVHDCQTRSLLDGPKWLVNFMPNAADQLESWISVTVPYGCLTIQFEAIAVEMATQRESRKVSISRGVVPPDLPPPPMALHPDLELGEFP